VEIFGRSKPVPGSPPVTSGCASASDAEAEAPLLERPRDAPFADFCNIYLTDLIAMLQAARSAARESSAAHLLQVVEFEQWARFVYHHS
jgi:hypothetical protein